MQNILLIEDNAVIAKGLRYTLNAAGYAVRVCADKSAAMNALFSSPFDLVLLDVMLPDGSGFEICREIRDHISDLPVIFLTAKDEESDVVKGFDLGADDYIIKPFRNRELISRIQNVLRFYHKGEREITVGDITVDTVGNTVYKNGEDARLSALEYRIVLLLFQSRGQTVPREKILDKIWDFAGNFVNDNTLTVYIKRIREKLGEDVIKTVKGIGYRVEK